MSTFIDHSEKTMATVRSKRITQSALAVRIQEHQYFALRLPGSHQAGFYQADPFW